MTSDLREGIVIRSHSGQCLVVVDGATYHCRVRGRLKKEPKQAQTVAVAGDRVRISVLAAEEADVLHGMDEEILPRHSKISRLAARRAGGNIEQVLMANLDQIVAVQSLRDPAPTAGLVDRLLVAAEAFGVTGALCLNKCDLDPQAASAEHWNYYERLGYRVLVTSALTGQGKADFRAVLQDKISLLLGISGVGKSSLLNMLQPGLDLRIASVGQRSGMGRHTTTRTELFALEFGGFIADSPGFHGFDQWDIKPAELHDHFPDWHDPAQSCRFRTCLHRDEPQCGIKAAVSAGVIPAWRYQAYLTLLRDLEERGAASR